MKNITISFKKFKEFDKRSLFELNYLYSYLYNELESLSTVSSSFVENEEDLSQLAVDAGYVSIYGCALDLLTNYGADRRKVTLFHSLGFISINEFWLTLDTIDTSIAFLKRFILSNAIWKEV